MPAIAFEDLPVGARLRFGHYKVTQDEILEFAREYDPQPFHVDVNRPGGVIASGWHTCAMLMRMLFDNMLENSTSAGAPGIDSVEWVRPVRPGMVLSVDVAVLGARVLRSRPELGLLAMQFEVVDETGAIVERQRNSVMFGRRDATAPIPPDAGVFAPRADAPPEPPSFEDEANNRTRFATRYNDVVVGARVVLGDYAFTRERLLGFARKYDPQPFHVDDAAAANSHFGRLAASGWHTAAAYMKCFVGTRDRLRAEAAARGEKGASGRPSPGFTNLRWARPVFVDDVISFETTVMDKRPSSKAGFGKILTRARGYDQKVALVFESHGVALAEM